MEKVENLATKSGEEGVQLGLAQNPENHATTGTHWNYQMRKSNAGTTQNQQFTHHSWLRIKAPNCIEHTGSSLRYMRYTDKVYTVLQIMLRKRTSWIICCLARGSVSWFSVKG